MATHPKFRNSHQVFLKTHQINCALLPNRCSLAKTFKIYPMKKNLFFVMALLSLSIATAQDFIADHIAYKIIPGTTTVEVAKKDGCYNGSVVIPETVTNNATDYTVAYVGKSAFAGCSAVTAVSLPNSVVAIKTLAFSGCTGLTAIELPDALTSIGFSSFLGCTGLTSLEIPNSVTSINDNAFRNCNGLTSVSLGESLVVLGDKSFENCSSLTSISIPDSVYYIGDSAFSDCGALTSATLGNSVVIIGQLLFNFCPNLDSITVKQSVPFSIFEFAFGFIDLSEIDLYVPAGSELAYKDADVWKDFNIVGANPIAAFRMEDSSEEGSITVFPLPANNRLNIKEHGTAKLEQATLLDFNGDIVKTSKAQSMDVSSLNKGLYTLKLETTEGVITKKVIKK